MSKPTILQEILRPGAVLVIDADQGTLIHYIDQTLNIRWFTVDDRRRFVPGFLIDSLSLEGTTIDLLKSALAKIDPLAQEIRHYTQGEHFFLCSIREPHIGALAFGVNPAHVLAPEDQFGVEPAAYLAPSPPNSAKGYISEEIGDLEAWLISCSWVKKEARKWVSPVKKSYNFKAAVEQNAVWQLAKILRDRGWHAPHKPGIGYPGLQASVCRPPGSFQASEDPNSSAVTTFGTRGRWMTLREAAEYAGLLPKP